MQAIKKIFSNTLYQTIGKVATMGTTILVTMLVTRHYGPQGYGELNIILIFPTLFFIVADFGMNAIVAGDIAKGKLGTTKLFNSLLSLRLVITVLLSVLGVVFIWLMPYSLPIKLAGTLLMPTVITFGIYTSTNAVYQAKLSYHRSMIAPIFRSITVLVLVGWLLSRGVRVEYLAIAYFVGDLVLGGLSLALVKKLVGKIKLVGDRKMYQYILVSALPLGIAAITNPIIGKADTLLLSVLKDESAVGFYSLAYKIFEVFLVVPVFFVNAAYPYMVKHFKEGGAHLLATSKKLGAALFTGGLVALGLAWVLAPFMIRVLGGEGFEASILPLRILALSFPVFFVTNILLWYLITLGRRRAIPIIYWLAVIINIGANLVVIPHYSFVGSAVVNGLTEVFVLVGLFAVVLSKHE